MALLLQLELISDSIARVVPGPVALSARRFDLGGEQERLRKRTLEGRGAGGVAPRSM